MSEQEQTEELVNTIKKLSPKEQLALYREALSQKDDEMDAVEEQSRPTFYPQPQIEEGKQQSDVINAKALEKSTKYGHATEVLREDFRNLTDNDIADIRLRHGDVPANTVPNITLIHMMGQVVSATNRKLYENNEIDYAQYIRNESAAEFAKFADSAVVNSLSAVEGKRFEGLKHNIMSGKQAQEAFQNEAKKKEEGRLSRLRKYLSHEEQ